MAGFDVDADTDMDTDADEDADADEAPLLTAPGPVPSRLPVDALPREVLLPLLDAPLAMERGVFSRGVGFVKTFLFRADSLSSKSRLKAGLELLLPLPTLLTPPSPRKLP